MITETSNGNPITRSVQEPQNDEVSLVPEVEVGIDNLATSTLPEDRGSRLEEASNSKLASLSSTNDSILENQTSEALVGSQDTYGSERRSTQELGDKLFAEHTAKNSTAYDPNLKPIGNRALNTLGGFGSTFVNELLVKPLDALGDLTGLYDLDTDGDTTGAVEDAFGYNSRAVEKSMENIGKSWDVASDEGAPIATRVKAVGNGMLEAFTTPEMLGTSFGALMSWVTPGALATKLLGAGSKYANTVKRVDELVAAGKLSGYAGKVKKAKAFMSVDGAESFLTKQSGFMTSALGNVNKQYEEFVDNNNGVELEGKDKAEWFAGRFAVQMVNQNLDKFVDFNVMKSPGLIKAVVPAVKAMTEKEFGKVVGQMSKGFAVTLTAAGSEAAQEYAQTSMELFNSRYGSEKFKDVDTFAKFLSNDENLREAGIAAIAGAGGSGQFEALGAVAAVPTKLAQKLAEAKLKRPTTEGKAETPVDEPITEDPVKAKKDYQELLVTVAKATKESGVNADNVGLFLEDLETLNRTKHTQSTSSERGQAASEKVYNDVIQSLEDFITNNADLKLGKRLVRKTIRESAEDKKLGSKPFDDSKFDEVEYDDYTRKVETERMIRAVMDSGKELGSKFKTKAIKFGVANGMTAVNTRNIIKSYESVETEATTGRRGYKSRLNRLQSLTSSSNPIPSEISKERGELESMYSAILNSEEAIGRGIIAAEQKAKELNKSSTVTGKLKQVTTEYVKDNGDLYKINIKKIDGVWTPDIKATKKLQETKAKYTSEILTGLKEIDSRGKPKSSVKVPVKEGKFKTVRQEDDKFLSEVTSKIDEVIPTNSGVNKVILGEKTSSKWKPEGDYYKANEAVINTTEYDSDDVVLINSIGVKEAKNSKGKAHTAVLGKEATKSVKAAVEAGATIVFDSDIANAKDPKFRAALAKKFNLKDQGYVPLVEGGKTVFVKNTEDTAKAVEASAEKVKTEKKAAKTTISNKIQAVSLYRALDHELDVETGEAFTDETRKTAVDKYEKLRAELLDGSFDTEDKLDAYLKREAVDSVAKAGRAILNDPNATPLDYDDAVFEQAVATFIHGEELKDGVGKSVLEQWSDVAELGLSSKERESELEIILERASEDLLATKKLVEDILGEKSYSKGKKDLYESVYQNVATSQIQAKPLRKKMIDVKYNELMAKNDEPNAHTLSGIKGKFIFLGSRRVVQDLTKIVEVKKTTVANTLPLDYLPFYIRDRVKDFTKSAKATLAKVSPAELAEQTYTTGADGKPLPGGFNLHNSPARSLFFNNEGKLNEEVMTATYLALGDMIVSDKAALSIGDKSDHDVAQMFNVQEFEITNEMRDFASQHGSLLKTVANKLGKNVLAQLGITRVSDSDTSANEYDSLISDIGNTALFVAQREGLLENTTEKSNKIAELYHDGEQRESESDTHFINLAGDVSEEFGYSRNEPTEEVEVFLEGYEESIENIPEASTMRKDGHFHKPTQETLDEARTTVRNDISGKEVPIEAQETIQTLMETAYTADLERIDEILEADKDGAVKKLLGYIELSTEEVENPEFESLYYKDKEVQEAKNNAITKTLDELVILKERMEDHKGDSLDLYFDYFYASNDRYMMDANTVNPQVDKLHRFLVTPKNHKLDYKVEVVNSGIEFNVDDSDQSFTVRMALSQAMGQGVDKMNADDIIDYGNVMLSMSKDEIAAVRKEIFAKGEVVVEANGKEYKIEAEHLSHTLQALKFLEDVQDAVSGNGEMTSSLSLEFDSLTSGFANKTQQMPIFDDKAMIQHFARTGVLTKEYQEQLKASLNYKAEGVEFDPKTGQSMADIISDDKDFLDSYKNMARTTITKLRVGDVQENNLSHASRDGGVSGRAVFEAIKPMLPGGESIDEDGDIGVSGTIRKMFKNPFMIFNYSAGIARITKNLGNDVAHDMAKTIATTNFELSEDDTKVAEIEAVAQDLIDTVNLINPDTKDIITSLDELQEVLRNNTLSKISLDTPFMVESKTYAKEKKAKESENLESLLENVMRATYGEVVDEVFQEEFKPFIDVQDAMNDTFKVAFRIFDKKRVDMLKELQKTKEDNFLSAEDHLNVLEELRDDFPWIVGPLTEAGDSKAVISVATTTTRPSNSIEESRKKPQAVLENGKTRTVTPLVKYLEEAVSSGSVLPFHAIDGAEIAKTLIAMNMNSIAAIHDAVIPPLNESDNVGFAYNKGMVEVNTEYSLAKSLGELVERMSKTINDPKFATEFKDTTSENIKLFAMVKEKIPFPDAAKEVVHNMTKEVDNIKAKRGEWYGKGGKLEGAYYGNLVGTPGGVYRAAYTDENGTEHKATTEPDLSYKERFKKEGKYRKAEVNVVVSEDPDASSSVTGKISSNEAINKDVAHQLGLDVEKADYSDVVEILEADSSKADALVEHYNKKLKKFIGAKTEMDIDNLIVQLSLFTSDVTIDETIDETVDVIEDTTSSKIAKASVSKSLKKNLKDCKV